MRRLGLALLALVAIPGCAVGPNYERPDVVKPEAYYTPDMATAPVDSAALAEAKALVSSSWWKLYRDTILSNLIDSALVHGYDVRMAAARVEQARALYGVSKADFYPQVGYNGGVVRRDLPSTQVDSANAGLTTRWTGLLNLNWELDLWGRVRRQSEQANAAYMATEEARRGVLISLVSDVAQTYFELMQLDAQVAATRANMEALQRAHDLFKAKLEGGAASRLEVSRALGQLASVSAQLPELQRQIVAKENQINLLVGRPPGPVTRATLRDETVLPDVPPGLPSDLLERRPDIRSTEEQLRSANAAVGVAVANFFPKISLTGLLGGVSKELSDIFGPGGLWSIGAGLAGPLFQGGRLRNQKAAAVAQWEQSKVLYERTVTSAFGEVSNALVARQKLTEVEEQQFRSAAAYQDAVDLANTRYLSGLASYFEVLDALQVLYPAQLQYASARANRLVAGSNLYKALGGGWESADSVIVKAKAEADSAKH
ncbi:MAG TPA: efflux transporter outer membrane subunit [Gemmatimonadales bacterium]|jgi:multidrug efflux system outer membrane protein|nr:efflux transporter outer membrane subunit [Gemmatimonadales bacterium]